MPVLRAPIFDRDTPVQAPEEGYELLLGGSLVTYHRRTRALTRHAIESSSIEPDHSKLYGRYIRKLSSPISAALLTMEYGPIRWAMQQMLTTETVTEHPPFVDPDRPEGYTHFVDDPPPEAFDNAKNQKQGFEWKTNIYGIG